MSASLRVLATPFSLEGSELHEVTAGLTLSALFASLTENYRAETSYENVVVAVNQETIACDRWDDFVIPAHAEIVLSPRPEGMDPVTWLYILYAVFVVAAVYYASTVQPPDLNGQTTPDASPTYSLSAQGNAARLGSPIPARYGRFRIYPDFASAPYREYINSDQYLYQLFSIGQGSYSYTDLKIGDTPIGNFQDVEYAFYEPGQNVTLFPADVYSAPEVSGNGVTLFAPNDPSYVAVSGPFTANASGTTTQKLAVDLILPRGLSYANDSGGLDGATVAALFEYREINNAGAPVGAWFVLSSPSYTLNTVDPQRFTIVLAVAAGRYEVRAKRTNNTSDDYRLSDEIVWAGLRSYIDGTQTFNHSTLAVKVRATDQLSAQSERKINVVATRKLPIWTGSAWSALTATRNPAWAFVDALKASYGGKYGDANLDLAAIKAVADVWAARGDYFDGQFDTATTLWPALQQICAVGRAVPYQYGERFWIIRDSGTPPATYLFNGRNIERDSMTVTYQTMDVWADDSVEIEYIDPASWKPQTILCAIPGVTPSNPRKVKLFGCTDRLQGNREGMFLAAKMTFRNIVSEFNTELDGRVPQYLDRLIVASEIYEWGKGGEVIGSSLASNFLLASGDFSAAAWTKTLVNVSGATDPLGGSSPCQINRTATGNSSLYQTYATVLHARETFTFSIWLKSGTQTGNITLRIRDGSGVNIVTLSVAPTASWARYSVSGTFGATPAANVRVWVDPASNPGAVGETFFAWGAQLEQGATMSSYVATGSSVSTLNTLTLSEPVTFNESGDHYIWLRDDRGVVSAGPLLVAGTGTTNTVTVTGTLPAIYTGHNRDKTYFAFAYGAVTPRQMLLDQVSAGDGLKVKVRAILDDPRAHQYDALVNNGTIVTPTPAPAASPDDLTISQVRIVRGGTTTAPELLVSWAIVSAARLYFVDVSYDAGLAWERLYAGDIPQAAISVHPGSVKIRIAAMSDVVGTWYETTITAGAGFDVPVTPSGLTAATFNSNKLSLSWVANVTAAKYRVDYRDLSNVVRFSQTVTTSSTSLDVATARLNGLGREFDVVLYGVNANGVLSAVPAVVRVKNNQSAAVSGFTATGLLDRVLLEWNSSTELDWKGYRIYASTTNNFTPGAGNLVDANVTLSMFAFSITQGSTWYFKIAAFDTWGESDELTFAAQASAVGRYITVTEIADDSISTPKLQANSVTASKMFVSQLSAITANLGAVTSGTWTMDNAGWLRAGTTGYKTGNGLWFGYDSGQYKFSLGHSSLPGVDWDGSVFTIRGAGGTPIFQSGVGLQWSAVAGTGKPADNATVGAVWNSNVSGQPADAAILNSAIKIGKNYVRGFRVWSHGGTNWTHTSSPNAVDGSSLVIPAASVGQASNSPNLGLWAGFSARVSFRALTYSGTRTLRIDFFPDTLPESNVTLTSTITEFSFNFTSSHADMSSAILRFWADAGDQIEIFDVKVELDNYGVKTPWTPHALDSVSVANPITVANISTYIAAAAISRAYIGALNVGYADILDANVGTLKLANNSVVIPVAASADYGGVFPDGNWQTIVSVTLSNPDPQPHPVTIIATVNQIFGMAYAYPGPGVSTEASFLLRTSETGASSFVYAGAARTMPMDESFVANRTSAKSFTWVTTIGAGATATFSLWGMSNGTTNRNGAREAYITAIMGMR